MSPSSICIPRSLAIIAIVTTSTIILIILALTGYIRVRRRTRGYRENEIDIEMQTQPPISWSGQRLPGVQWTNPDPWAVGPRLEGGGELVRGGSVRTLGSLPSYHERVEDDPRAEKGGSSAGTESPVVSPRTVVRPRREVVDVPVEDSRRMNRGLDGLDS